MNNRISTLNNRENKFNKFIENIPFSGYKLGPGLYIVDIPENYFNNIFHTAKQFLSKVITRKSVLLGDAELYDAINSDEFSAIECITPSGMILPKIYSSIEYNLLMKSFYDLMKDININVESWYSIMPLRYKAAYKENYKPGIQYSHELHLDSWTGFSNFAYCAFMPIIGDISNNYIEFWEPISGIDESWISGFKTISERNSILNNFKKIDFKLSRSQLAFADSYVVHKTNILPGAGPRIGIDNLFRPQWAASLAHIENLHRNSDLRSHLELTDIGIKSYYDFIDDDSARRPSEGGLKSPVGFNYIQLK